MMFPYIEHAQVSSGELAAICLIPAYVFIAWLLYTLFQKKQLVESEDWTYRLNQLCVYFYFLCFSFMCLALTMMFTDVLKTTVAMPRPNFFYMCDFKQIRTDYDYYLQNVKVGQIVDTNDCFASQSDVNESQVSFPSGHSSYSMSVALSAMVFTCFMKKSQRKIPAIATFLLFFLAIYVGVSRIMDYYHNVWDVLFGFFLAICVTGTSSMVFYESLSQVSRTKFIE